MADVIQAAKSKVMIPAVGLIATGVLTLGLLAYGIIQSQGQGDFETQWAAEVKKIEDDATKKDAEKKQAIEFMDKVKPVMKPIAESSIVFQLLAGSIGLICIVGGVLVVTLKSRGMGIAASIVSMLPLHCCCFLGIIFGIWLIVVLSNDVVKRGFAAAAGESSGRPGDDHDPGFDR